MSQRGRTRRGRTAAEETIPHEEDIEMLDPEEPEVPYMASRRATAIALPPPRLVALTATIASDPVKLRQWLDKTIRDTEDLPWPSPADRIRYMNKAIDAALHVQLGHVIRHSQHKNQIENDVQAWSRALISCFGSVTMHIDALVTLMTGGVKQRGRPVADYVYEFRDKVQQADVWSDEFLNNFLRNLALYCGLDQALKDVLMKPPHLPPDDTATEIESLNMQLWNNPEAFELKVLQAQAQHKSSSVHERTRTPDLSVRSHNFKRHTPRGPPGRGNFRRPPSSTPGHSSRPGQASRSVFTRLDSNISPELKSHRMANGLCLNCGEKGHRAAECRRPPKTE